MSAITFNDLDVALLCHRTKDLNAQRRDPRLCLTYNLLLLCQPCAERDLVLRSPTSSSGCLTSFGMVENVHIAFLATLHTFFTRNVGITPFSGEEQVHRVLDWKL